MFDFQRFCEDYDIPTASRRDRHHRTGYINLECPFCDGNVGNHLGYNLSHGYFNCFRCGFKSIPKVIYTLLGKSVGKPIKTLINEYGGSSSYKPLPVINNSEVITELPPTLPNLTKSFNDYLTTRNFVPSKVVSEYDLKCTELGVKHYDLNFSKRLIIPIYKDGVLVSFQTRNLGGTKDKFKYITCPKQYERVHHKHTLYNIDNCYGDTIIVLEGVTDVWRMGWCSCATFGIEYKEKQVELLSKYKNVFVMFDSGDKQAVKQAEKLSNQLSCFTNVSIVKDDTYDDPASMPQEYADKLIEEILSSTC